MDYFLIIYFFAGVLQDFLFTLSLRFVNRERPIKAATVAFLDNFVSVAILYDIISALDAKKSLIAIIIYSLGISVGTYLAIKLKIRMEGT